MRFRFIVCIAKVVGIISRTLGFGAGATWPGEIALRLAPDILRDLSVLLRKGAILVAGTNGKTTTSLMVKKILEEDGCRVIHNASGANLLNGVVSSFIQEASWWGDVRSDWGVFEIDENSLPIILSYVTPRRVILLNLFRDQLDRYGEVDVIVEKWVHALSKLPASTQFILNSDDPGIAEIGTHVKGQVIYFGLNDASRYLKTMEHATDSTFCSHCGQRLAYEGVYYSHIGIWRCVKCGNKRPSPSVSRWQSILPGLYNQYNTLAAVALAKSFDIPEAEIKKALHSFVPAFGRQEEIVVGGKTIKLFLSKNPAGFNASLRTVLEFKPKILLFVLNDRIPDGRDVSWIWDVDFEMLANKNTNKNRERTRIFVSGDRCYDMALRLKYVDLSQGFSVESDLAKALEKAIGFLSAKESLYILPTYSAMLEVRKLLRGRKIL